MKEEYNEKLAGSNLEVSFVNSGELHTLPLSLSVSVSHSYTGNDLFFLSYN